MISHTEKKSRFYVAPAPDGVLETLSGGVQELRIAMEGRPAFGNCFIHLSHADGSDPWRFYVYLETYRHIVVGSFVNIPLGIRRDVWISDVITTNSLQFEASDAPS